METFKKVKEIAQANKAGFTISLIDLKHQEGDFWVVAFKETQDCFNDEGLKKVIEFAKRTTNIIGGWKNEDNTMQYDCVMLIQDQEIAIKTAKENLQRFIYNLKTKKYLKTM